MIVVDRLIIGGLRFVLDKVAQAVDSELNDPSRLREELLAARMRLELGEIDEREFAEIEASVFQRLREMRERRPIPGEGGTRVTGAEILSPGDDD
jgi:hypothetical protein